MNQNSSDAPISILEASLIFRYTSRYKCVANIDIVVQVHARRSLA